MCQRSGTKSASTKVLIVCIAFLGCATWLLCDFNYTSRGTAPFGGGGVYIDGSKEQDWVVSRKEMIRGGIAKEMIVVNGLFPGPTVHAKVGETVMINVHNELAGNEGVSIHWHGINQRGSNTMDGAVGITQCAIPPGHNFTYVFTPDKPGTYWWHAHSGGQRVEGLLGGFIVYGSSEEKYTMRNGAYDDELLVIITDQYHDKFSDVLARYTSKRSKGFEPVPDGGLINGHGRFNCSKLLTAKHRCMADADDLAEFILQPNRKYRIRIINASAFSDFKFSIDNHELEVIEADGTEVESKKTHYIPISSGQRYSAIIHTKQWEIGQFFMRAEMDDMNFNYLNLQLDPEVKAIITYDRNSIVYRLTEFVKRDTKRYKPNPSSKPWSEFLQPGELVTLQENSLRPLEKEKIPEADIQIVIYAKVMKLEKRNRAPFAFINRTSHIPAIGAPNLHVAANKINVSDIIPVPTITGGKNTEKWGGDQLLVDIPYGSVVDVIINNIDESLHPFHLHGHHFWVLSTFSPKNVNGQWSPDLKTNYNIINPIKRDTLNVPSFGHSVIRWRANNPGIWALHCHMEWHMSTGMLMQFAAAMENFTEEIPSAMIDHVSMIQNCNLKFFY